MVAQVALERRDARLKGKEGRYVRPPSWSIPELPDTLRQVLTWEREGCGQYITSHPLEHLDLESPHSALTFNERGPSGDYATPANTWLEIVGVLVDVEVKTTKRGNKMAIFGVECLDGVVPCVGFGERVEGAENGWVVRVKGVIEDRDAERVLKVTGIKPQERW